MALIDQALVGNELADLVGAGADGLEREGSKSLGSATFGSPVRAMMYFLGTIMPCCTLRRVSNSGSGFVAVIRIVSASTASTLAMLGSVSRLRTV